MSEERRRNEALAAQRRQFLQAFSTGALAAVDRFGNPIQPGCKMLFRNQVDMVVTCVAVNPVLDPRVPPGQVDVILSMQAPVRVTAGQQFPFFCVVGQPPAEGQLQAPPNGQPEDEGPAVEPPGPPIVPFKPNPDEPPQ